MASPLLMAVMVRIDGEYVGKLMVSQCIVNRMVYLMVLQQMVDTWLDDGEFMVNLVNG